MITYRLIIELLSDTTFGRGDGVAGLIDREIEHDRYGFPFMGGRTLKGLLREECDNLIVTLDETQAEWKQIACKLFGIDGSGSETIGKVHFGDAQLPKDLREAIAYQIDGEMLNKAEVLDSLTAIRRQTAIDERSGTADEGSLRSFRVVIRELRFTADLNFAIDPTDEMLSLLAVGALSLRYAGSGRNRGRGHIRCRLLDKSGDDITDRYASHFGKAIQEKLS
jgi:CRISPR/Cas system CSM-associated protein Csm3 (group 7 of RAMP superfamily)